MITAAIVRDVLADDPTLASVLTGGIWDRGLKRSGPFATEEAFDVAPPHDLLPCAVVTAMQRRRDQSGPPGAYSGTITVWLKARETEQNRAALETAALAVYDALENVFVPAGDGTFAEFTFTEGYEARPDPVIPSDLMGFVRFAVAGIGD